MAEQFPENLRACVNKLIWEDYAPLNNSILNESKQSYLQLAVQAKASMCHASALCFLQLSTTSQQGSTKLAGSVPLLIDDIRKGDPNNTANYRLLGSSGSDISLINYITLYTLITIHRISSPCSEAQVRAALGASRAHLL